MINNPITNYKVNFVRLGEDYKDYLVLSTKALAQKFGLQTEDTFKIFNIYLLDVLQDMDGYEDLCRLKNTATIGEAVDSMFKTNVGHSSVMFHLRVGPSKNPILIDAMRTLLPGCSKPCLILREVGEEWGEVYTRPGKNVVYYHDNCMDGLGAKFAAWLFFGNDADYRPFQYGKTVITDVENADVYFLDSSVKLYELTRILDVEKARTISIVDHHKTAKEDLVGKSLPNNVELVFDMARSGAVLAWDYFFEGIPVPRILELIQDRDLWKHQFKDSTLLYYAKQASRNIDERFIYDCACNYDYLNQVIARGVPIKEYIDVQLENLQSQFFHIDIDAYKDVPVINCAPNLISDVLNYHLAHNAVPFAAAYFDQGDVRKWSLRSSKETGFDVSALAKQFGGGGHAQAAGFVTPLGKLL